MHENLPVLMALLGVQIAALMTQMTPNQARARDIANGYAVNAVGAVTGVGRVFFALGQGVAPIALAGLYEWHPTAAYLGWLVVQVCCCPLLGPPPPLAPPHGLRLCLPLVSWGGALHTPHASAPACLVGWARFAHYTPPRASPRASARLVRWASCS